MAGERDRDGDPDARRRQVTGKPTDALLLTGKHQELFFGSTGVEQP
jgi:hypothetical protein